MNLAKFGDVEIDVLFDESVSYDIQVTEHPVEKGVDIVDHVKERAFTMSISGAFTGKDAWQKLRRLKQLKSERQPQTYAGRNLMHNMIISDLSTSHPVHNKFGADFSMTLTNIKLASKKRFGTKKQASQVEARTHRGRQQVKER